VRAMGYDEDTELLHLGTTSGRSVFNGLRRVDNTTGSVAVAISASNNFIVEE
jgi:trimeric autotransporter adhesin